MHRSERMLGEIVPRKGNVNLPKRAGIHFTRAKYRGCELTLDNAVILRPHACARAMKVPTRDVWVVVDRPVHRVS